MCEMNASGEAMQRRLHRNRKRLSSSWKQTGWWTAPPPAHVTRSNPRGMYVGFVPKGPTNAALPNSSFPPTTTKDSRKDQPNCPHWSPMFGRSGSQTPWRLHRHSWLEDYYWWKDTRMKKRKAVVVAVFLYWVMFEAARRPAPSRLFTWWVSGGADGAQTN